MSEPQFSLDRTGFPMIYVDVLGAELQWLPLTKIQLEYFLCDRPGAQFDEGWYNELLRLNERVAPRQIRGDNYWGAFATGLKPHEAQTLADWYTEANDEQFEIPSNEDWFSAYQALRNLPEIDLRQFESLELSPRAQTVVHQVESAAKASLSRMGNSGRSLADQMLMRQGVLEWVTCNIPRSPEWGAFGQTNKRFHGHLYTPDLGKPNFPADAENQRYRPNGVRLLRRL
jgi:hypothetical protein